MKELWYKGKDKRYPIKVITKPYSNFLSKRLVFMPRYIKAVAASNLKIRRLQRFNYDY